MAAADHPAVARRAVLLRRGRIPILLLLPDSGFGRVIGKGEHGLKHSTIPSVVCDS